ncbi:YgfZ/GcvT domain-containing protein [Glaciihabitans tibetensis]|uniref:CAF17-like 4Fe-4S cluster assembly/insertion protein YgfZ n=1 Tax=Glaciihabitans tibetensis TaxID=1266600 RepID=UPI000D054D85|nr:glycine cleavage T C-terminal barrel domain-containing protein [Glaciihabitans tibetensis]
MGSPPQHYGNPLHEQRLLAEGTAVVDLSDRAVLTVTGPDRLSWIDSLTSQAVAKLQPGESAETLLLDPAGRLEYAVRLLDDGVSTWLLLEATEGAALHTWLDRMRFMLRVEVADRSAEFATIGTLGSPSLAPAAPNGIALHWRDPWSAVVTGGHQYSTAQRHPSADWTYSELLIDRAALPEAAALPAAGTLALEALRIAAWRPRRATEVDERTIPHELDWLRSAVHLSKGCYRGQETVAKVHNLGHPPRRLVLLHLDGSEGVLPVHGDIVLAGDKEVGSITSAALHYELGPIALAVVKRSVDPALDLVVTAGDPAIQIAAAQEVIVPPDAGAEANVPRLPRLGAVRR